MGILAISHRPANEADGYRLNHQELCNEGERQPNDCERNGGCRHQDKERKHPELTGLFFHSAIIGGRPITHTIKPTVG